MSSHSVARLTWERGSQGMDTWKKEPPGDEISSPGDPKWLSGPPGASWATGVAQEGALGGQGGLVVALFSETAKKLVFDVFRPPEDVKTRLLGRFWILFLPPGGGRLREVIFGGIVGSCLEVFWAPRPRS